MGHENLTEIGKYLELNVNENITNTIFDIKLK